MLFIVPARAQASRTRRYAVPAASLTPSARSGGLSAGDGTKNGLPAPNKELALGKSPERCYAPIQINLHFLRRNTMPYSLKQAAEATGKTKPTILRAIQSSKISATRHQVTGAWQIDPAELHRVYPALAEGVAQQDNSERVTHDETDGEIILLRRELQLKDEHLRAFREERQRSGHTRSIQRFEAIAGHFAADSARAVFTASRKGRAA